MLLFVWRSFIFLIFMNMATPIESEEVLPLDTINNRMFQSQQLYRLYSTIIRLITIFLFHILGQSDAALHLCTKWSLQSSSLPLSSRCRTWFQENRWRHTTLDSFTNGSRSHSISIVKSRVFCWCSTTCKCGR